MVRRDIVACGAALRAARTRSMAEMQAPAWSRGVCISTIGLVRPAGRRPAGHRPPPCTFVPSCLRCGSSQRPSPNSSPLTRSLH